MSLAEISSSVAIDRPLLAISRMSLVAGHLLSERYIARRYSNVERIATFGAFCFGAKFMVTRGNDFAMP